MGLGKLFELLAKALSMVGNKEKLKTKEVHNETIQNPTHRPSVAPSSDNKDKQIVASQEGRSIKSARSLSYEKKHGTVSQIYRGSFKGSREVVIGFDLGTSCSKVILQDRQLKKCYAISFDDLGYPRNKYLLPTKVFISRNGQISLHSGDYEYRNIKMNFIHDPKKEIYLDNEFNLHWTATDLCVGYLGLVLMEARRMFFSAREKEYKDVRIDWEFNIGTPSRSYDDKLLLNRTKIAGLAAWSISLLQMDKITIHSIKKALERASLQVEQDTYDEGDNEIHPSLVGAMPEIIAEVVGFAKSPLREDGMYMMVDVGSITVDASTFIIHKNMDEEDAYAILTSSVENNGTYVLHNKRIRSIESLLCKKIDQHVIRCDEISPVPDPVEYAKLFANGDTSAIRQCDIEFQNTCSLQLRGVIKETKINKNPLSEKWVTGLPLFLCGGGSHVNLYKELPEIITSALKKGVIFNGFNIKTLPRPKDIEEDGIPVNDYHRMAVAYGLSFSINDIGVVTPERNIKDISINKERLDIDSLYISKDLV